MLFSMFWNVYKMDMGARTDARVASQAMDVLLVLVCQFEGSVLVLCLAHSVGLQHRAEHREAVLHIERLVVAVCVDACTFSKMVP